MLSMKRRRTRSMLDKRLGSISGLQFPPLPIKGYIRAVREAIGMTSVQLASRLGLSQSSVVKLEQSEQSATIQLNSLRKVAEAMDCELIYAFIPIGGSFEGIVRERAREIAIKELRLVDHTMKLEDQEVSEDMELEISYYITEHLKDRDIWKS